MIERYMVFIAAFYIALAIGFVISLFRYHRSTYHQITGNGFFSTWFDKGRLGEYQIYKRLKHYEKQGDKFLFNLYLPKQDGTTSEIDVLMLSRYGLFVFESKNYSGWIFGNEHQKSWVQTLPQGKGRKAQKEHFYNPVKQNAAHIRCLRQVIDNVDVPMWSVIAFSERCTLKKVEISSSDIFVVNRDRIEGIVRHVMKTQPQALSGDEMQRLYEILLPTTKCTDEVKQQHIQTVMNYRE